MPMFVQMAMGSAAGMDMPVGVREMALFQQGVIGEDFRRCSGSCYLALGQHENKISDVFDNVEIVGCSHNRASAIAAVDQETNDFSLAFRIKCGCRFIEKQHLRFENEYRSKRYTLFLTSGESVWGAIPKVSD